MYQNFWNKYHLLHKYILNKYYQKSKIKQPHPYLRNIADYYLHNQLFSNDIVRDIIFIRRDILKP